MPRRFPPPWKLAMNNPRVLIAALVVTLTLLFAQERATAAVVTLEMMKQTCEELESFWQRNPPKAGDLIAIPNQANAGICFGYLTAFYDLSHLIHGTDCVGPEPAFGPNCQHTLDICVPKSATITQTLAVFLAYARSHVAQWHEAGWGHFLNSWLAAFPCKDEYPETTR
jgi:Rap1a immunity proteins